MNKINILVISLAPLTKVEYMQMRYQYVPICIYVNTLFVKKWKLDNYQYFT